MFFITSGSARFRPPPSSLWKFMQMGAFLRKSRPEEDRSPYEKIGSGAILVMSHITFHTGVHIYGTAYASFPYSSRRVLYSPPFRRRRHRSDDNSEQMRKMYQTYDKWGFPSIMKKHTNADMINNIWAEPSIGINKNIKWGYVGISKDIIGS